jgi:hypothetical protein
MDKLPTTLSPDTAVAIVALVERSRFDAAGGFAVAAAVAGVAWWASARWVVGAIGLCVVFPVAARAWRALRLRRLRQAFARDPHYAWRAASIAWENASAGQRAALQMVVKKSG